ncbi:aldehyde ferredoxin oxidoreductase family protein [uncultured Thermanaerothrix sp.]|uniref:aldehyde ferredoxin oxidoreductase family protein n=1 Tax=uncultured Thermanaerothrix sp. TaxID=1195149 RepID=UPI002604D369|nr:aldehyde ferredoxin oxidoreductase family protein [uncultured Thermanaerothrix sp.]
MALGGYANRIAHVDLSTGTVTYEPIREDWALKYIGARGLGDKYVFENGYQVDPLSPENILCFMTGPLTGTEVTMSGRMAICTKSPLTGTIMDSHHGGWSGARLKWAGLDGIIVKGKAAKPVYLYVEDGKVEIHDAADLWGKTVHETIKALQEKYGEKDLSVLAIGPAGERLVKFANWINEDDRASGRGGTGCVGGSKLLKAIVIKAEKKMPKAVNRELWKTAHQQALAKIMDPANVTSPRKGGLSVYGTNVLTNITSTMGALPARNAQRASFVPKSEKISGEWVKEHILVDDPTCHACPVACKKEVEIKEGPFAGLRMESFEYEPAWSLGAMCDNDDAAAIAKMIDLSNDYGYDAIEIGDVLAMYMEATQRGYVNGTGGLQWGDVFGMIEFMRKIAYREGVGDILAEGTERAAKHFGHPELAMTVKGMGIPAYDPRGLKGMGLGYATSNRGACHLRGYSPASELGLIPLKTDPLAWEGKGKLLKLLQDLHAFSDSLDLCKFSAFAEAAEDYAAQFSAVVGIPFTADDVLKTGERIYNLERYYNNLCGFREGSDTLPKRFLEEPSQEQGSFGHVCELDKMLEEYYRERGWVNGVVPESKLKELEII